MNISLSWLRTYVDSDAPHEVVAETLTRIGHEVDEIRLEGSDLEGVVVGKVLSVEAHPDADRLRVCQVDVGASDHVQIVCGAANVAAGQFVPVAMVGCVLPVKGRDGGNLTISKASLRGVASEGMICAEDELGLGSDHSGILVLDSWVEDAHVGRPLSALMNVGSDVVFDIGLTPNRPDAASHMGMARDLACALDKPFNNPLDGLESVLEDAVPLQNGPDIMVSATEGCPRYVGMVIRGVNVGPSPLWLKVLLRRIGLRPVNNVVDITNYVLHDIGQPLHAFDLDRLRHGTVNVRTFEHDVPFTTLDHVERMIPAGSLFICDGDRPVALAGIMGGLESEVSESTQNIFLESAYFNPTVIRKTSKRTGIQTDASYRYERGTDPMICAKAAWHAAHLIAELCGGVVEPGLTDVAADMPSHRVIELRASRVDRILGTVVGIDRTAGILQGLGIACSARIKDGETMFSCDVPSYRPDISREIDLVEEVGRILDYNLLPVPTTVKAFVPSPIPDRERFLSRVRDLARGLGYQEIVTNSLLSREKAQRFSEPSLLIDTLNPVSQDATTLRTSLMPGVLDAIGFNVNHGATRLRLFEMGHIYAKTDGTGDWFKGIRERTHLMLSIAGRFDGGDWTGSIRRVGFEHLKADVSALFDALGLNRTGFRLTQEIAKHETLGVDQLIWSVNGTRIGTLVAAYGGTALQAAGIDVPACIAELDLETCFTLAAPAEEIRYNAPSRFPIFEFDAAFVVQTDQPVGELEEAIRLAIGEPLHSLEVFDLFEGGHLGEGKKSVAFRLRFLDHEKTLSANLVEPWVRKMVDALNQRFGAQLRS